MATPLQALPAGAGRATAGDPLITAAVAALNASLPPPISAAQAQVAAAHARDDALYARGEQTFHTCLTVLSTPGVSDEAKLKAQRFVDRWLENMEAHLTPGDAAGNTGN